MIAGTDLKPVAFPKIPEGYRWVVKESHVSDVLLVLEQQIVTTQGIFKRRTETIWKEVSRWYVDQGYASDKTPLAVLVKNAADKIVAAQIARLEKDIERQAIIGVYEA